MSLLEKHNMEQVLKWFYTQFSRSLQIFTARKGSCRKVMFSQMSICPQGLGWGISGPMSFLGMGGYLSYQVPSGGMDMSWVPILSEAWDLGVGMFKWVHTHPTPGNGIQQDMFGKRAVCILLECLLNLFARLFWAKTYLRAETWHTVPCDISWAIHNSPNDLSQL